MGSKKTTTESNQQSTATTQLPAWMTTAGQDLYSKASVMPAVGAYQGEMAAGSSPNQQAASAAAQSGMGAWLPALQSAAGYTMGAAGAPAGSVNAGQWDGGAASRYMSPYTQQVQQNTLDTMRKQDAADHQTLNDSVQGSKAFGGSRQAILEGTQARDQSLARQNYVDSSNAAAYEGARAQFNTDADRSLAGQTTNAGLWEQMLSRMMTGGSQMGQIAEAQSNLGSRDIANLSMTGGADQQTQQNQDTAAYSDWLRSQGAPLENIKDLMAILQGTPRNTTTTGTQTGTQTQTQQGSFLDTMLGLGQLGLSAYSTFSDPRLKKDVALIERDARGLGTYRFRYLWERPDEIEHIGVMADEVAHLVPEALGPVIGGYLTVDYGKLGRVFA